LSGFYYFSPMYKSNFLLIILIVLFGCTKDELQDLGKLWISTGIINEDGLEKEAYSTWKIVLDK